MRYPYTKTIGLACLREMVMLVLLWIPLVINAQHSTVTTEYFTVTGLVKNDLRFGLDEIQTFKSKTIKDVVITNHLGEPRKILKNLSGVLVKDLLKTMELKADNPKLYSEFYLTFVAIDGYKIVYSWNEIFNTSTGDNLYLITAEGGKQLRDMDDKLLILTPNDFQTGRRHIKGLSKIIVNRVD